MSSPYTVESETEITAFDVAELLPSHPAADKLYYKVPIGKLLGAGGMVVNTTATALSVTAALHANKLVTISSAAPAIITLPAATGTGNIYRFAFLVAATATATTIKVANATDIMMGYQFAVTTSSDNAEGFKTTATDDTMTFNGTTKGGVVGDQVEIIDAASGKFVVRAFTAPTGTEASIFSASV